MLDDTSPAKTPPAWPLYLAVLHHPVRNKSGEVITSSIDSFDFFDVSRLSLTYPIAECFFVNHLESQQRLVERLVEHAREQARDVAQRGDFTKTHWAPDLDTVVRRIRDDTGAVPITVATTAEPGGKRVDTDLVSDWLVSGRPVLLVFGKAWGLTAEALDAADHVLEPIDGGTGYNHLSVRSAISIVVDRLFGRRPPASS